MDKTVTEVFGEITYSQAITYEDLLSHEQELLEKIDKIFLYAGAEYLDFTPAGDILRWQCGFEEHNLELFRVIARKIAAIMPSGTRGRLFCLEKDLSCYHLFWFQQDQWQETEQLLSSRAPEDIPVQKL